MHGRAPDLLLPLRVVRGRGAPLLKAAAIYFDKLHILDPSKASSGTIGSGEVEKDVVWLGKEGILERVKPEEVLRRYEDAIGAAIFEDLQDPSCRN